MWKWFDQYGLKDRIEVTGYISDAEVSREIKKSDIATLLYEDGLTLRRGSFLAYLTHGVPIITTMGDEEAAELFGGHPGIFMAGSDDCIIEKIFSYSKLSEDDRSVIHDDNTQLAGNFNWDNITKGYLKDYGLIE